MITFNIILILLFVGIAFLAYQNYKLKEQIVDLELAGNMLLDWAINMEKIYVNQSKQIIEVFNKNTEDNRKIVLELYEQNNYNKLLLEDLCDYFDLFDEEEFSEKTEEDIIELLSNNKSDKNDDIKDVN